MKWRTSFQGTRRTTSGPNGEMRESEQVQAGGVRPAGRIGFLGHDRCKRAIVTSFMDYANAGASWMEAEQALRPWVINDFGSDAARVFKAGPKVFRTDCRKRHR